MEKGVNQRRLRGEARLSPVRRMDGNQKRPVQLTTHEKRHNTSTSKDTGPKLAALLAEDTHEATPIEVIL